MKLSRRKFLVVVAAPVAVKAAPSAVVLKPRSRDMLLYISSFKFHGIGSDLHRQYLGGSRIQSPFTYKK